MPIYEYECRDCGHRLDALQKISEPVLVRCPACQQDSLRKLVSAPLFRLKGSGWYETDFKKDKRRNLAGDGEKDSGTKSDGSDKNKSDSAPDKSGGGKSDSARSDSQASSDKKASAPEKSSSKAKKTAE